MKKKLQGLVIVLVAIAITMISGLGFSKVMAGDITFKYDIKWENGIQYWHFPSGFYCIQNGQRLNNNVEMNKIKTVDINGRYSNYNSNAEENAVMAYILHQNDEEKSVHWSNTENKYTYYTPKQNAIYGYAQKWLNANHINDISVSSNEKEDVGLVEKGINYANSIKDGNTSSWINNKTNKDKIETEIYNYNGNTYMKAGPLSWEYYEGLDSVKVIDQNNNEIGGMLYGTYKGTDFTVSSSPWDSIWSGNEFYILVPDASNATKVDVRADVSTTRSTITAKVDFYGGSGWYKNDNGVDEYGKWQNVIYEETSEKTDRKYSSNTIEDIELYIDLSGYVWIDKQAGKQSLTNDLYKDSSNSNYSDTNDVSYNGITVRLKDKSGNVVKEAKTSEIGKYSEIDGGEYFFEKVPIAKLAEYYVEFEYDGLTYTNVVAHTDKTNGSKAIEGETTRNNFNLTFSTIENGVAKDQNGSISHSNMTYTLKDHTATFDHKEFYAIQSKTSETPYNLYNAYKQTGGKELRYVNLGLFQREQPDIALVKDVQNSILSINGYNHLYNYASRFDNNIDYTNEQSFNVGVQFQSDRIAGSYSRPVYKSDSDYTNTSNPSKELKVSVTYRIKLVNQSTNLATRVNNVVDYFDNDYSLKSVGTGVDANGNVTGTLGYTAVEAYNGEYNKTIIDTSALGNIEHQNSKDLYVQFEMGKSTVVNLLNSTAPLNNVAEINSYSVFDGKGKVYAGVDKDSNPGNTVPGDINTYEDDTDKAPAFILQARDDREMTGTVFVDQTTGELKSGEVRTGDGIYKEGEDKTIEGVTVTLIETGGAGVEPKVVSTDQSGNFKITGYIPGEYQLMYTWGNEEYNVQNYKAVAIEKDRWNSYGSNPEWYKTTDPRQSDAIDDYANRKNIDAEIQSIENNAEASDGNNLNNYAINKMNSTTQKMSFPIEYKSSTSSYTEDKLVYAAQNLDFGIVERARQALNVDKRVGSIKVTLANGQVVIDATIDENGKLQGETKYLTYMGPSQSTVPANGYAKIELDNELIQGATINIGYIIEAKNISEKDFVSEDFYTFGIETGDPVTITPTLYDYMDNTMAMDDQNVNGWQEVTIEDYNKKQNDPTIIETNSVTITQEQNSDGTITTKIITDSATSKMTYSEWKSTIIQKRTQNLNNKITLYNQALYNPIATGQSNTANLYATKLLANTDEVELNNQVEITKVQKNGGSEYNYKDSKTHDEAETVTVVPSTGEDRSYIIYIAAGTIALIVLATGIVIIRKKALGNK